MSRIESLGKCLVERYGLTRKDAETFVSEMFAVIRDNIEKDRVVKVKGLGTFKLADMNPRESVDVNTGERILIEGRAKLGFTPENAVRDRINSPFAQFETIDIDEDVDFTAIDEKYNDREEAEDLPEKTVEEVSVTETAAAEPVIVPEEEESPKEENTEDTEPVAESTMPVAEEPEGENTVAPVSETVAETTEKAPVHNPFCEDLIREGITHSRKIIRLLYLMLALIIVVMLAGALYMGYRLGAGTLEQKVVHVAKPAAKVVAVKPKPTTVKPIASTEPTDTVCRQEHKTDSVELMQAEYNKDARVRTGAYRIVGLSKVVKLQAGQTFGGICRAYLGDGMECYVEVYNGGKHEFATGDEIKIPLLKLKKRTKK